MNSGAKSIPDPTHLKRTDFQIEYLNCAWVEDSRIATDRVILFFHGGGYHIGGFETHKRLMCHLATAAHAKVLFVDYRKAPEFKFPAPIEDAKLVYQYLLNSGYSNSKIAIAGDSAGGGLALAISVHLKEENLPLPTSITLISPWVDLSGSGKSIQTKKDVDPWLDEKTVKSWGESYIGHESLHHPFASPLYANLENLPPILIHVGTNEVLLDDSTRLYDRLIASKIEAELKIWEGMIHVFQNFDYIYPEANKSIVELGNFIQHHFSKASEWHFVKKKKLSSSTNSKVESKKKSSPSKKKSQKQKPR